MLLINFFLNSHSTYLILNVEWQTAGESYAGKYIPYLAYTINQHKQLASKYFNFKGMAIGDGWTDPINQLKYDELLYQIGLVDLNQKILLKQKEQEVVDSINKEDWIAAYDGVNELLNGDSGGTSLFINLTGITYYYNFLQTVEPAELSKYLYSNFDLLRTFLS